MSSIQAHVDGLFHRWLEFQPERRTLAQIGDDHTRWSDLSPEGIELQLTFLAAELDAIRAQFADADLTTSEHRLYDLVVFDLEDAAAQLGFHDTEYAAVPMTGIITAISQILAAVRLHEPADYVARLEGLGDLFGTIRTNLDCQLEAGIVPPQRSLTRMAASLRVMLAGYPIDDSEAPCRPLRDLRKHTDDADLLARAEAALKDGMAPAIQALIETLEQVTNAPPEEIGIHRAPRGKDYYEAALRHHTQTEWSAEEIHELGKQEVAKTRVRVREVMQEVGFNGDEQEFFAYMRDSPDFSFGEGDEARQRHLDYTQTLLRRVQDLLPQFFNTLPKAECRVERMPEAMEAADFPIAMAQPAPPDGSRSGKHLLNQSKMQDHATYIQDALLVHESLPGHVMQFAVAQESERVNDYQRLRPYDTAYAEGWALYCETLAEEMGVYQPPYDRYGWFTMDLWRCCRLVVDTGMHALGWTRQQAIEYMMENTSLPVGQIENEVDRYAEWPAQALGYKIGALRLMEIRKAAEARLGKQFDLKAFHDEVLVNGPLPIPMLDQAIQEWCENLVGNDT
ncbi:MAG: DUF885 domain-containing protein [Pseudomonadales bacterium]|nr:DUF885 domain-containing protein [Kiritimatiellia bacterium]MDP6971700.1 DUF885 domain-containing protein [Pseudomonadales bacterium]